MRRIVALDIAKGFAIICVVLGHVVSRGTVAGAEWYSLLKTALYSFHMPLFMSLSGMALGLSWRHRSSWGQVSELVKSRIRTLMVPYVIFGLAIVAGKLILMRFIHIDHPPENFLNGVLDIVLYPAMSASVFLWYIQVLAMYFLVFPWLLQYNASKMPWALLGISIILNQYGWTPLLNMAGFVEYLPFFSAGILMGQNWGKIGATILAPRYSIIWFFLFSLAIFYNGFFEILPKWFIGTLSIPAVLSIAQAVCGRLARFLEFFGNHTFSIYLMNTIFIGLAKALLFIFIPWRDAYFIIYFIILSVSGLMLPVLIKSLLSRNCPNVSAYI
ncbi:acyltransferase family protein [Massilia sp. DWR3-1-1]|uniref:acyltransferase family protein n=1 Tax=Massilia sp. DWR3-1-1 TaxID=2804559 RepID=UPI003CF756AB